MSDIDVNNHLEKSKLFKHDQIIELRTIFQKVIR